jgi:hypothetical protein
MVVGMASMVVMMASILPGPDGALRRCPGEGRRSVGERQGDGFAETMRQARASPELPTHGGDRTHIVVTRNCHDLRTGIGTACLDDVGDVFEEREGGAVPEGRLRTPQDSTSARIWPTSASKRRVSWIRRWRLLTSSKGPARHRSWSAGMGVCAGHTTDFTGDRTRLRYAFGLTNLDHRPHPKPHHTSHPQAHALSHS